MSDLVTLARRVAGRGKREATELVLDTAYRIDRFQQRGHLPELDAVGRRIVDTLQRGEIAIVSIDELGLASSPAMEAAAEGVFADMRADLAEEGPSGEPLIRMSSNVPEIRAWATERSLSAIAANYIGLPPRFQGVHARIERVNEAQVTSEQWHRDLEDRRMLKAFFFPHDLTLAHGPFEYVSDHDLGPAGIKQVRRAVKEAEAQGELGISDPQMAEAIAPDRWRTSEAPARTVVFADPTASYHHGRLRTIPRESLFFVWTSAFPRHPEFCEQYWNDRYPSA